MMVHFHLRLNTYFCRKESNWEFLGLVNNYQLLENVLCHVIVPNVTAKTRTLRSVEAGKVWL